jgi:RsiW-degrading membrane proteinase PrsW (M82 family)
LTDWVLLVIVSPITEEPFKALSILLVVLFMWRTIPNRRWAAALGAVTGLGFAIAETIVYAIGGAGAEALVARIIVEPFMHPLWSAFVAMGIFVLLAKKPTRESALSGLGLLFLFMGLIAHMIWNGLSTGLAPSIGYVVLVVNLLLVFLPFAVVLRDLLGGHFNFQNFFEPVLEPSTSAPISPPPPPPPPP